MAIDFPDTPLVNDTFTSGDRTWKWNGTAWRIVIPAGDLSTVDDDSKIIATQVFT